MNAKTTAVPIPDDWDDLDDDQKNTVTAELLKRVADETGVPRDAPPAETGEKESPRARTFRKPT